MLKLAQLALLERQPVLVQPFALHARQAFTQLPVLLLAALALVVHGVAVLLRRA